MRGTNITNKYIIDSKDYLFSELTKEQLVYVETMANKTKYNNLRNQVIQEKGNHIKCTIIINVVDQVMTVFDEFDVVLFKV